MRPPGHLGTQPGTHKLDLMQEMKDKILRWGVNNMGTRKMERNHEQMKNISQAVQPVMIGQLVLAAGCRHTVYRGPPSAIRGLMDDWPEQPQEQH